MGLYNVTENVSMRQVQTKRKFSGRNDTVPRRMHDKNSWVMFLWLMSNVWEPRQSGPQQPKICLHSLPAAIDLSFELSVQEHFYWQKVSFPTFPCSCMGSFKVDSFLSLKALIIFMYVAVVVAVSSMGPAHDHFKGQWWTPTSKLSVRKHSLSHTATLVPDSQEIE